MIWWRRTVLASTAHNRESDQKRGTGPQSTRGVASWLAWAIWVLSLALTACGLGLLVLNLSRQGAHVNNYLTFARTWVQSPLLAIGFSTVGALVASRSLPANPIGWLFCAVGFLFAVDHAAGAYAAYTVLTTPPSLPAGEAVAWIYSWIWIPTLGCATYLVLVFPQGRLRASGWRWFAWSSLFLTVAGTVAVAFSPGPIGVGLGAIHNPLGIEGLPNFYEPVEALLIALIFVASTSLLERLRYARGIERQQIKWVVYATALAVSGAVLTFTVSDTTNAQWLGWTGFVLLTIGVLGVPISMGIAVMRYGLYHIDMLINRTLVYGLLTGMLAAVYFGGVAATAAIFRTLTGQEQQPQMVVVVSTLVIAVLFTPLRRRIQGFIDRRFYRRKYDARKTLEAFGAQLREETDLDCLRDDLVGVVRETMQPAHISLWLRPDGGSKESGDNQVNG
jgi:hypothetical protein